MPLYVAEVTTVVLFCAKDQQEAERVADGYAKDEIGLNGCNTQVRLATTRNTPREWMNCMPHGTDDQDARVGQMLRDVPSHYSPQEPKP